uniref:Uncharacterized protein n=1 Tax=Hucho hucho TaxID=62062 RepID=A0A4W5JYA6_9TELE
FFESIGHSSPLRSVLGSLLQLVLTYAGSSCILGLVAEVRRLVVFIKTRNGTSIALYSVSARGETLNVFLHDDAVYGLSVSPVNDNVFASSSDDGRVLIWDTREPPHGEPFCLANYPSAFHSVMFNPAEPRLLATANSKEGVGLWDIRKPRTSLLRYGGSMSLQSAMSVRFNSAGTQLLALRRRLPPVLYELHSRLPSFQFDNQGYFNSCTMKSCCFAGDEDQVR